MPEHVVGDFLPLNSHLFIDGVRFRQHRRGLKNATNSQLLRTVGAHGPAFIWRAYPSWVPRKFELSGEQLNLCIAIAIPTRIFNMDAIAA